MSPADSFDPLAQIVASLANLPSEGRVAADACAKHESQLTKPAGALGRLEGITRWLAAWQGTYPPNLTRVRALVFAANHGVAVRGVSAYPAEVTAQMVANFKAGGAAINQLCAANRIELSVIPIDLDWPTQDFTTGPAMTAEEFIHAFDLGVDAVTDHTDLLVLGEMGIANTTAAAAVCTALYGGKASDWTGAGTGVEGEALARKIAAVECGVDRHGGNPPLDLLRRLGGREMAAIAGAVVAARRSRVPVLLDGFVCTAAAAPLAAARAGTLDHCLVAHVSAEPGHRRLLDRLSMPPLLDLGMRLGEGSGAALAVGLVRSALACHNGMATFAGAGVSGRS